MAKWTRGKFSTVLIIFQIIFLVLFAIFVEYGDEANARPKHGKDISADNVEVSTSVGSNPSYGVGGAEPGPSGAKRANSISKYYPMFQDVHVMMYIGFGFLMTFLKKYGFGAIGINMLIAAFVVQWHILMSGFLELEEGKIHLSIVTLMTAEFAAAAVLISFGAGLGKLSPLQLIIMSFLEIIVFSVNEYIGVTFFKAVDMGGSMFVHVFGAYFGISAARVLYQGEVVKSTKEGSDYRSDLFSMIGTVFLWLFWPSFNAALAPGDDQHRAVINTYLALASCCIVAFSVSSLVNKHSKFDMVHVQNATLAGGVAVGTSADLMIHPWGAVLIGAVAGCLSVIGYSYIQPFLVSKLKIHDTCGVNNLHGMPGILGGIAGCIASAMATEDTYGMSLYEIFPARMPTANSTEFVDLSLVFDGEAGDGRSASVQAGYQILTLVVTIVMAILGGVFTGFCLRFSFWGQPSGDALFDDVNFWELPEGKSGDTYTAISMTDMQSPRKRDIVEA